MFFIKMGMFYTNLGLTTTASALNLAAQGMDYTYEIETAQLS